MKKYILKEETAKAEFELLHEIYQDYKINPWSMNQIRIKTLHGTFENFGGFNGNPGDLWLKKVGTNGNQKRTFWRAGIGSKKMFKVFIYDFRFSEYDITSENCAEIAEKIGATIFYDEKFRLKYFTK